jgi:endonuclease-3
MTAAPLPFDIDAVMAQLREAARPYPKAALFELAEDGYGSVFEQLSACILSIRNRDEVTLPTARRLFARARTPAEMAALSEDEIDALIGTCTFHRPKAAQIRAIALRALSDFGGALPCDAGVLTSFHGVGVKCANLVLGIACGQPRVAVDIHVHRVTNRWGYVATRTPEETTVALEERLPEAYRVEINALLVPFGKHICTGTRPRCSTCLVRPWCAQVGITDPR